MNYQEVWDIAHAIGYHQGRMLKVHNTKAIKVDREAFDSFLKMVHEPWANTAVRARDAGIEEGVV